MPYVTISVIAIIYFISYIYLTIPKNEKARQEFGLRGNFPNIYLKPVFDWYGLDHFFGNA